MNGHGSIVDSRNAVKVLNNPFNVFESKLNDTAVSNLLPLHPVDMMQRNRHAREAHARTCDLTAQYGIAAAMTCNADVKMLSSIHRLPGLESSFCALENYTGDDISLRMEDWLGDPQNSDRHLYNIHRTMERKLNI